MARRSEHWRVAWTAIVVASTVLVTANTSAFQDVANTDGPGRLPLVVERAEIAPGGPSAHGPDQISVSVHNAGDKTIVAWGVRSQITFADGKTSGGGVSIDEVEYRGLERRGSRVLPPGGRNTITFGGLPKGRPVTEVRTVTAEARFVIFDDDSALGEERMLSWYFDRRAENQRAWPMIDKAFTDAMARSVEPRQAILDADRTLEAITDEGIRTTDAYTSIRRFLMVNLRNARDPAALLKNVVDEVRIRRQAADGHYQRRR